MWRICRVFGRSGGAKKSFSTRAILRISALLTFFISFITNSILVYYFSCLFYIVYYEFNKAIVSKSLSVKHVCLTAAKYIDFLLLPFAFYLIKNALFAPYGPYQDYNQVTLSNILNSSKHIISNTASVLYLIYHNWLPFLNIRFAIIGAAAISITCFVVHRKEFFNNAIGIVIGILLIAIGIFPYDVAQGCGVETSSTSGRDSMLVGFGAAVTLYYLLKMFFRRKITCAILMILTMVSIAYFDRWYLDYQRDYYRWLAMSENFKKTPGIENGHNFILISRTSGRDIGATRFYTLNGASVRAFGTQDKFFCDGVWDLQSLNSFRDDPTFRDYRWMSLMSDYDINYTDRLDGVIVIGFDMPARDFIAMKCAELTDSENFNEGLKKYSYFQYYPITEKMSAKVITAYEEGKLTSNEQLISMLSKNID